MNRTITMTLTVCALALGFGADLARAITVNPQGAAFTATTAPGARVRFILPGLGNAECTMATNGTIPTTPTNNGGAAQSVTATIATPVFGECITSLGTVAEVRANATFGTWSITWATAGPLVAAITVPSAGVAINLNEAFFNCIIKLSATANTPLTGAWTNPGSAAFTGQQLSATQTGISCPPSWPVYLFTGTLSLRSGITPVTVT
jgi:hypothetical protein